MDVLQPKGQPKYTILQSAFETQDLDAAICDAIVDFSSSRASCLQSSDQAFAALKTSFGAYA